MKLQFHVYRDTDAVGEYDYEQTIYARSADDVRRWLLARMEYPPEELARRWIRNVRSECLERLDGKRTESVVPATLKEPEGVVFLKYDGDGRVITDISENMREDRDRADVS